MEVRDRCSFVSSRCPLAEGSARCLLGFDRQGMADTAVVKRHGLPVRGCPEINVRDHPSELLMWLVSRNVSRHRRLAH
jgi:hypothetical protein